MTEEIETVAGVPTTTVLTSSFEKCVCNYGHLALKAAKKVEFRPRNAKLESDEAFQQFVVYMTFTDLNKEQWLYYSRTKMAESEERLTGNLSVGFGGHVNQDDFEGSRNLREGLLAAAIREQREEIPKLDTNQIRSMRMSGWIRDTSNPVGRVHLGVYIECTLDLDLLLDADLGFPVLPVASVDMLYPQFETWSQIVLKRERIVL